jgi:hypothetical protein
VGFGDGPVVVPHFPKPEASPQRKSPGQGRDFPDHTKHQLRGSPLAIPILIFFVLSLPALLRLRLLLSGLSGLSALLARALSRLAALLTRLSALLTVLFHIVCHEYTPHSLQARFPAPAIFVDICIFSCRGRAQGWEPLCKRLTQQSLHLAFNKIAIPSVEQSEDSHYHVVGHNDAPLSPREKSWNPVPAALFSSVMEEQSPCGEALGRQKPPQSSVHPSTLGLRLRTSQ